MNLEDRIQRLEVQNISYAERIWDLTGRLIKLEDVLRSHIIVCSNTLGNSVDQIIAQFTPEELSQKLSAVAFDLSNILPAVANVIRLKNGGFSENIPRHSSNDCKIKSPIADNVLVGGSDEKFSAPLNRSFSVPGSFPTEQIQPSVNVKSKRKGKESKRSDCVDGISSSAVGDEQNEIKSSNFHDDVGVTQNLKTMPFPSSVPIGKNSKNDTSSPSKPSSGASRPYTASKNSPHVHPSIEEKHVTSTLGSNFTAGRVIQAQGTESSETDSRNKNMDQRFTKHIVKDPDPIHCMKISTNSTRINNTHESKSKQAVTVNPPLLVVEKSVWDNDEDPPWEATNNVVEPWWNDDSAETDEFKVESGQVKMELQSTAVETTEPLFPKETVSSAELTRISSSSSLLSPATSSVSIPVSTTSKSSGYAFGLPSVDKLFNDYMKRHTTPKLARKEWMKNKFASATESQKEEFIISLSRHAVKQTTGNRLAGIGHMVDVMIGANVVSQEAVIKGFAEGIIADLPIIYGGNTEKGGDTYDGVMSRLPFVLVTIFNDTMKDLNWLVDLGKDIHVSQPQIWFEFACEVIGVILDRKKQPGALKLWNQTGQDRISLEQAAVEVGLY